MKTRCLSLLLALFLLFPILPQETARAAEEAPRLIHVVYDDSGSMYQYEFYDQNGGYSHTEYYDKWCRARYAMEVFAAMMEERDEMNIYLMSERGRRTMQVSGSDSPQSRIDRIHSMTDGAIGTYYETVTAAYDDLMAADGFSEKWLVILTDGDFEGSDGQDWKPASELNADFSSFAASGVKVVYLAIGEEVREMPASDPDAGIITRQAAGSDQILSSVTDICNTIYERQQLPESFYTYAGNTLTLDFDVPMERIFILSQGENAALSGEDASVFRRVSDGSVRYSEEIPSRYSDRADLIPVARDLTGVLAEFASASSESPIPAGQYTFSLTGAASVQIYFEPAVRLAVTVSQNGEAVSPGGELLPGECTIEAFFEDPSTGERLVSDILSSAVFSGTVTTGGEELSWEGSSFTTQLAEGPLEIQAAAELPGDYSLTASFSGEVAPPLGPLYIEAQPSYDGPVPYGGLDGTDELEPYVIRYSFYKSDPDTGERVPLTEAELDTLTLTVTLGSADNPRPLTLDTCRGADGQWLTDPAYLTDENGDPLPGDSFYGTATLYVSASFTADDGQQAAGTLEVPLVLDPPPWYIRYFWPIFWGLLILLAALAIYLAYIRPARFVRGKNGMKPSMTATRSPATLRPRQETDPASTSRVKYGPTCFPFRPGRSQKATVHVGCYNETHFTFTVEAVRVPGGGRKMKVIGLREALSDPRFTEVKINGRELERASLDRPVGYHLQLHYNIGGGKRGVDYDFKL